MKKHILLVVLGLGLMIGSDIIWQFTDSASWSLFWASEVMWYTGLAVFISTFFN